VGDISARGRRGAAGAGAEGRAGRGLVRGCGGSPSAQARRAGAGGRRRDAEGQRLLGASSRRLLRPGLGAVRSRQAAAALDGQAVMRAV